MVSYVSILLYWFDFIYWILTYLGSKVLKFLFFCLFENVKIRSREKKRYRYKDELDI